MVTTSDKRFNRCSPLGIHLNFYRVHLLYFISTILLASIILWSSTANVANSDFSFHLRFIDALFLSTSAVTNSGLNTVNLSSLTSFQQTVLGILMFLGNILTVASFTVWHRRHYCRQHMKKFLAMNKVARGLVVRIAREKREKMNASNSATPLGALTPSSILKGVFSPLTPIKARSPASSRRNSGLPANLLHQSLPRTRHHERGFGGFPFPWEWPTVRKFVEKSISRSVPNHQHNFSFFPKLDSKGRFHSLSIDECNELGGAEYRALGVLSLLLPAYVVFWLAVPIVILVPWSYKGDVVNVIQGSQVGHLNPGWFASFLVASAFGNCGLSLLNNSMISFQGFYLPLIVLGAAMLAGNTFFTVFLRVILWVTSNLVPRQSRLHYDLQFLLHYPRRCFILLFPAINTWHLAALQSMITVLLWIFWICLQLNYPSIRSLPVGFRTFDGLFQAIAVRVTGLSIISMSSIAPALLVLYAAAMYISALPIIIAIRSTNIYEEKSIGIPYSKPLTDGDHQVSETSYIATHFQRQLASDAWWLFTGFFLICVIERTALSLPSPGFDVFAVLFETVSAFGCVGLSTGAPYDTYSLCGAWQSLSKLILVVIMLKGRHRGLPMAIDRAVLLPGQELMERMDRELNGSAAVEEMLPLEVQEVRRAQNPAVAV